MNAKSKQSPSFFCIHFQMESNHFEMLTAFPDLTIFFRY